MQLFRNARSRLIAAIAVFGFVAMATVLGLAYWTANRIIEAETREVVSADLAGLADSYGTLGMLGLARAINRRIEAAEEPEAVYLLTDPFGGVIAGNLGAWPPTIRPNGGWAELDLIRTDNNRTVPVAATAVQLRGGERLLVGRDASARQRFDRILGRSLGLALVVAAALSLITGWLLSRLVFSRVAEISGTAQEIISGDLSRRIPLRGGDDEFDRLGATLNEMLTRIEDLVANLRMTTDSMAHDLRSPLTRLQAQIATVTDTARPEAERGEAADRARREIDHLLRIFSDLTEIARADARIGQAEFANIALDELVTGVAEFYAPAAEDRNVTIRVAGRAGDLTGHRALLTRALSNLLENALRHAPPGSEIAVGLDRSGEDVTVTVADRGPGIPEDRIAEVVKPFVTLDQSRGEGTSGLGLALVQSIARLHGGHVTLRNLTPGLEATIHLRTGPTRRI